MQKVGRSFLVDQRIVLPMLDAKCYGKSKTQVKGLTSCKQCWGMTHVWFKILLQNNTRCCILRFISGIIIQNNISSGVGLLNAIEPFPRGYDDCASPALRKRHQQVERCSSQTPQAEIAMFLENNYNLTPNPWGT